MFTIITCPTVCWRKPKKNGKHLGVELTEKDGQKSLSFAGGPPFVLHPELPAIDERLKMMADSKLAMAALEAHTATLGYRLTGEQGENWCNVYNDGIADLVKRYPDRFVGMASVPLQDPARAAKVLERAVRDLNFRGGYIGTNVNGNYYGTTDFDPFWAKAQELDVMVVMHPEDVAGADKMNPVRPQINLRQSRRQRALLRLHDLQRRVRSLSQLEAVHSSRRRILPVSSRPLRPRLGSPRRRARGQGKNGAERVS